MRPENIVFAPGEGEAMPGSVVLAGTFDLIAGGVRVGPIPWDVNPGDVLRRFRAMVHAAAVDNSP